MTNLFAVEIKDKKDPYIFCVADSQASGDTRKKSVQKLVQRGSSLLMYTGRVSVAEEVYSRLPEEDVPVDCLAGRVLEVSEELAREYRNEKDMATFILVAGMGLKGPAMYEVPIIEFKQGKQKVRRRVERSHGVYSKGSGSVHVGPAYERDWEKGFALRPSTPMEALLSCYGMGNKANNDLWVNDELQIGVVSGNGTRMLLPPSVRPERADNYMRNLTGIKVEEEDPSNERIQELMSAVATTDAFYHALKTMMNFLQEKDTMSNRRHANFKVGNCSVDDYVMAGLERAQAAGEVRPYVEAFVYGGIARIGEVVEQFSKQQLEIAKIARNVK